MRPLGRCFGRMPTAIPVCIRCYDEPSDVRVDPEGHVFVDGVTSSPPYLNEVILLVLDTATGLETNRGIIFNVGSEIPSPGTLRFDGFQLLHGQGQTTNHVTITADGNFPVAIENGRRHSGDVLYDVGGQIRLGPEKPQSPIRLSLVPTDLSTRSIFSSRVCPRS